MIVLDVDKIYANMSVEFLERQRRVCLISKDEETLEIIDRLLKERRNASRI